MLVAVAVRVAVRVAVMIVVIVVRVIVVVVRIVEGLGGAINRRRLLEDALDGGDDLASADELGALLHGGFHVAILRESGQKRENKDSRWSLPNRVLPECLNANTNGWK